MSTDKDKTISKTEAMTRIGVTDKTLAKWIKKGRVDEVMIDGNHRPQVLVNEKFKALVHDRVIDPKTKEKIDVQNKAKEKASILEKKIEPKELPINDLVAELDIETVLTCLNNVSNPRYHALVKFVLENRMKNIYGSIKETSQFHPEDYKEVWELWSKGGTKNVYIDKAPDSAVPKPTVSKSKLEEAQNRNTKGNASK